MIKSKYLVIGLTTIALLGGTLAPTLSLAAEDKQGVSQVDQTVAPISQHTLAEAELQVRLTAEGEALVKELGPMIQKKTQESELYASVILAQGLLESNFATSKIAQAPYYNLFGILANEPETGISFSKTSKNPNGGINHVMTKYRIYDSYADAISDYMKLLADGITNEKDLYQDVWRKNAETYQDATLGLAIADSRGLDYAAKLNKTIDLYELTQYDQPLKVEKKETPKKVEAVKEKEKYQLPLKEYQVTSEFGSRYHPIYGDLGSHNGIDLAAPQGTAVHAVNNGSVVQTGFDNSAGNFVIIQDQEGVYTSYFHLASIMTQPGTELKQGDQLGTVGSTGDSTGAHLHFAFSHKMWSDYLDPRSMMTL